MSYPARRYRIEGDAPFRRPAADEGDDARIDEILATLRDMKRFIDPLRRSTNEAIDSYRKEIVGAFQMRVELDVMKAAILATRREIGSLHAADRDGQGLRRVAGELDALGESAEVAATTILGAVETIEAYTAKLRAATHSRADEATLDGILRQVVVLYEACNFQDLSGQRITKIVSVMKFVEDRIDRMIGVWGEIGDLDELPPVAAAPANGENVLRGPRLPHDLDHVSQTDIDSLFD